MGRTATAVPMQRACTAAMQNSTTAARVGIVLHHTRGYLAGTADALPGLLALPKSKGFVKSEYYVEQIYGMGSAAVTIAFAACPSGNTTTSG